MKIRIELNWHDKWIGVRDEITKRYLEGTPFVKFHHVWICLIPCLAIHIWWHIWWKKNEKEE